MFDVVTAVIGRDLKLAMRRQADIVSALFFFVIVVSLFQYWIQVRDVMQGYNAAWVGVAFATVMLTFVVYLRLRLFPEIRAIRPAKDASGQYAFA